MKYQECWIAWTPNTSHVRTGPAIRDAAAPYDWTKQPIHYVRTAAAQDYPDMLMLFHLVTVRDRVPADVVHQAFLEIDEYRALTPWAASQSG